MPMCLFIYWTEQPVSDYANCSRCRRKWSWSISRYYPATYPKNTSHKHYFLRKLAHFFQWCVCVCVCAHTCVHARARARVCVCRWCVCNGQNVLFLAENKKAILKNKLIVKLETITCCVLIYLMCSVQNVEHSVKNPTLSLLISWLLTQAGDHKFPKM